MTGNSGLVEGAGPRPSWLRRLWFRLLLLFRRISRLFGAGAAAQPAAPPDAGAYAFERVPAGPPFHEVNHPVLRSLRRRALGELFDWLGLDFVPGQLLERSDHGDDPIAAFTTFLRSVGCDPERVRRRDPAELARLRDAVDLLMAFDSLTARLEPAQRDALQLLLLDGDIGRLRMAAERLFALSGLLAAHEALDASVPLAAYEALAARAKAMLGRLLALTDAEVAGIETEAERWRHLARRRALLAQRIAAALAALDRAPQNPARAQRRNGLAERQHAIGSALSLDPGLTPAEAAALLDELDGLLAALQDLLREAEAEAEAAERFRSEAATDRLYRSDEEAALAFFGLARDARPDGATLRAAWRRYMKDHHPDLTTDARQKARRDALCQEANLKRRILERAFAG